ncbi:hypothetical protein PL11_007180 [Lentilactobacillus curieae]|uniref:DUF1934 domain-containing protein n=1 Tax=Lentilactobacillus curieae TaxID=1138822 RepID=A0A1S6QJE6_9LACO|nr:DUF1934 domain-containing protein [Lentilactobacillus curieae]AQW21716.1 hypothetical protein PL11_007180 [Lentilactobacillus curieae]
MDNPTNNLPVQIHLRTDILQDGKKANYVFDMEGQLVEIGDAIYIRYDEETDGDPIPVTIKIMNSGDVKITRAGENRSQLMFSEGKRISAVYKTPYGPLDIQTVTPGLEIDLLENPLRGNVDISYLLYAGQELLGKYNISLQFTV